MNALRKREFALGASQEIVSLLRGVRLQERMRIGKADVLDSHAHHAPGKVERVFAAIDHTAQPIKGGVGVGTAHRLVKGADEVVMPVAVLVVERRAALHEPCEFVRLDGLRGVVRSRKDILGQIQHRAAVAIRHADQGLARIGRQRQRLAQNRLGPLQEVLKILIGEALEDEHLGAGEERAVQLERRVLGRGADQNDGAVLDIG